MNTVTPPFNPSQPAAGQSAGPRLTSLIALVLALGYPALLQLFFLGNTGVLPLAAGYSAFALALLTPWYGLLAASRLRQDGASAAQLRQSRYLMLLSVLPSAYCLLGVTLYLLQASALELPLYYAAVAVLLLWQGYRQSDSQAVRLSERAVTLLRVSHGISALLLLVFISVHLLNHLAANLGGDVHLALMKELRHYYRHPLTESLLVGLCLFQLVSGLRMAAAYLRRHGDAFHSAQLATGLMLAVFLSSHLLAVLVLGRWVTGVDTNWNWLVYQPGLLKDAWNVRLVSHYTTGVLALVLHLGLALRLVLRAHGKATLAACVMVPTLLAAVLLTVAIMRPLLLAS
jgi:hypothetical protein